MNLFKRNAPTLSAEDFLDRVGEEDAVLDVRTPAEFAGGHLAGSENVDFMAPDFRERVEGLDRDRTYYLYCRSGTRSGKAATLMQEMGFSEVYNVGGFEKLAEAGAETTGGDG